MFNQNEQFCGKCGLKNPYRTALGSSTTEANIDQVSVPTDRRVLTPPPPPVSNPAWSMGDQQAGSGAMYPPPPPLLPLPPEYQSQTPMPPAVKKKGALGKVLAIVVAVLLVVVVSVYASYTLIKPPSNGKANTGSNPSTTTQATTAPTDTPTTGATATVGQTVTASPTTASTTPTPQTTQAPQSTTLPYKANFAANATQWSSGGFQVNTADNTISCGSDNPYSATPGFTPPTPDYTVILKMQFISNYGNVEIQARSGTTSVSYNGSSLDIGNSSSSATINRTLPFTISVTFKGPSVSVAVDQAGFHYTEQGTTTGTGKGEASISTNGTAISVSEFEIKQA